VVETTIIDDRHIGMTPAAAVVAPATAITTKTRSDHSDIPRIAVTTRQNGETQSQNQGFHLLSSNEVSSSLTDMKVKDRFKTHALRFDRSILGAFTDSCANLKLFEGLDQLIPIIVGNF
jgi:hypothetical protein